MLNICNMHGCNQNITLWYRCKNTGSYKDSGSSKEFFKRVDIPVKCKWRKNAERIINGTSAVLSDNVIIIIPYYPELSVKPGDIIALGLHDIDITGISPFTLNEVKQELSPDIITVMSVAYNFDSEDEDFASMHGKHMRIVGK